MREEVLRDLARRAATDPGFLKQSRRDLEGTLAGYGYDLTREELRLVDDLRRRTASMSDEHLARTLASGLREHTGSPPARPTAPSWRGSGPARRPGPGADGSGDTIWAHVVRVMVVRRVTRPLHLAFERVGEGGVQGVRNGVLLLPEPPEQCCSWSCLGSSEA